MALVRTFRIDPTFGVPDKAIQEFINEAEKDSVVSISTVYIPAYGKTMEKKPASPRLTVIVTRLDDPYEVAHAD